MKTIMEDSHPNKMCMIMPQEKKGDNQIYGYLTGRDFFFFFFLNIFGNNDFYDNKIWCEAYSRFSQSTSETHWVLVYLESYDQDFAK